MIRLASSATDSGAGDVPCPPPPRSLPVGTCESHVSNDPSDERCSAASNVNVRRFLGAGSRSQRTFGAEEASLLLVVSSPPVRRSPTRQLRLGAWSGTDGNDGAMFLPSDPFDTGISASVTAINVLGQGYGPARGPGQHVEADEVATLGLGPRRRS